MKGSHAGLEWQEGKSMMKEFSFVKGVSTDRSVNHSHSACFVTHIFPHTTRLWPPGTGRCLIKVIPWPVHMQYKATAWQTHKTNQLCQHTHKQLCSDVKVRRLREKFLEQNMLSVWKPAWWMCLSMFLKEKRFFRLVQKRPWHHLTTLLLKNICKSFCIEQLKRKQKVCAWVSELTGWQKIHRVVLGNESGFTAMSLLELWARFLQIDRWSLMHFSTEWTLPELFYIRCLQTLFFSFLLHKFITLLKNRHRIMNITFCAQYS